MLGLDLNATYDFDDLVNVDSDVFETTDPITVEVL
jgi:hypothetical protein